MLNELLFSGLVSFVIVIIITPSLIKKLNTVGVTSEDLHKLERVKIPRAGGMAVLLAFSASITLAGLFNVNAKVMILIFLVSVLGGFLGLIDDFLTLSKKSLIIFSLLIGIPFLTYRVGSTIITLTPFGPINLGLWFWPLALLSVAFLSNAVNIYAGFNGLEAGLGAITSLSLGICSVLYGAWESAIALFSLVGALLGFLRYNFYPARIFIGNSGTYLIGSVLASSIIVGTIKMAGVIACVPYIVNFVIRVINGLNWTVGELTSDGRVVSNRLYALWSLFIYKRPLSERELVVRCWLFQAFFGSLAIVYSFLANVN